MSNFTDFNGGVIHMNNKRRNLSLLFALFLTLGAVPAWAASPAGNWCKSRFNDAGSSFVNMTLSNTTFCYLSKVSIENTDTDGEMATCQVTRGSNVWTLEAILAENNDADARCCAYCYNE